MASEASPICENQCDYFRHSQEVFLLLVTNTAYYLDHGGKSRKTPFKGVKVGAFGEENWG